MILYDLICDKDHQFESWFRNSSAADKLMKVGQVSCPACGSAKVKKAMQAPRITSSRAKTQALPAATEKPAGDMVQAMEKMTEAFNELRKTIEKNFDHVGDKFPDEARKIHYGEAPERGIYGNATPQEAKDLTEEGIKVMSLPWPRKTNA
ncbi:MAG: DUF1178 family protein [Rhodospirillaceae bacterium]|nr:DUF1178 family protein [Rhodospirillaceae bacterium]